MKILNKKEIALKAISGSESTQVQKVTKNILLDPFASLWKEHVTQEYKSYVEDLDDDQIMASTTARTLALGTIVVIASIIA